MSRFFIWNIDQKKYVAQPGQKSSFTKDLTKARGFDTRAAAEGDCCGNERVCSTEEALYGF